MDRGMKHDRMLALVAEGGPIKKLHDQVTEFFESLERDYPKRIENAYDGKAAAQFTEYLRATASKMNSILTEMTKNIKDKAEERDAAYREQEKKLENSVG